MDTATRDVTRRWTVADLYRFPDDGYRREIIDGELLVSPGPIVRHQAVVGRFTVALHEWAQIHGGAAYPGVNVTTGPDTNLEPDAVWTSDTDTSGFGLHRSPEIVVEVGSPSTRRYDHGIKRQWYLANGSVEVWLVDLDAGEIEVHTSVDGDPVVLRRGDTLTTDVLPGFAAAVADLLG